MSRITNSMLTNNYLNDMQRNLKNLSMVQNQMSSGQTIRRGSEDPSGAARLMQLNSDIATNKQYNANITDTSNWLDTTDTALSQAGNVLSRIRELMVKAGNGTYKEEDIKTIKDEVTEDVKQLVQNLNTSFNGAYIFGGTKSTSKPLSVDGNGTISYSDENGKAINTYLNIAGGVTDSAISNNKELKSTDSIYLDKITGKTTTAPKAADGTDNTQIIKSTSLYLDGSGNVTTAPKTAGGTNNRPILLKDDLYKDLEGNITPSKITDNTLITSDNELFYVTSDGKVTTSPVTAATPNTLIPTGTPLYSDVNGKVTNLPITGSIPNSPINQATSLYTDELGNVTISSITVNDKLSDASVAVMKVSDGNIPSTLVSMNPSSGDIYMDSRGNLTNSSTTNLADRKASLTDLWNNSYIDSANNKVITSVPLPVPLPSPNTQINLYKDSNGQVTTLPGKYPPNEQILSGTPLYQGSNGKVTTIAGGNTLKLSDAVYVDLNGDVTTSSTITNTPVSVRDNLCIDPSNTTAVAKTVIGSPISPSVKIPSDAIILYTDANGNFTADGTGANKTKIILADALYVDSYENVTTSDKTKNVLVNSDDKLYVDANKNVVNSEANIQIITGTTLYKDSAGRVTTLHGETPPNEPIDLEKTLLYKDGKGNVTTAPTLAGVPNTLIDSKMDLYKDVNGNVTTVDKNTQITPNIPLYKDLVNGNVTTDPVGMLPSTTPLYIDGSGNVTTLPGGLPPNAALSGNIYVDTNGNVTTLPVTPPSTTPNTPIPSDTKFYVNPGPGGQVKTSLILTGDPMYEDKNGKIITSITTPNTKLTAKDKVYIDDAGNLTMSPTTANEKLTMGDIRNLKNELNDPSTTSNRTKEINKILDDPDIAPLMQLDSDLNVEISQGVIVDYNKTAADIFQFNDKSLGSVDTTEVLSKIIDNLSTASDPTKTDAVKQTAVGDINNKNLKEIDAIINNLLQTRSSVGTLQNRMDSAKTTNEDQNYNMTSILSSIGDIDLTEKTVEYSTIQTVYTAALQTSSKILKNTILDYI